MIGFFIPRVLVVTLRNIRCIIIMIRSLPIALILIYFLARGRSYRI